MGVYANRLILVRTAIDAILAGGQDVSYANRRVTFADLRTLRQMESDYESKAAQEASSALGRSNITYIDPL